MKNERVFVSDACFMREMGSAGSAAPRARVYNAPNASHGILKLTYNLGPRILPGPSDGIVIN